MTPAPSAPPSSSHTPRDAPTGNDLRVLVVDDDFRVAGMHADAIAAVPGCVVVGQARTARDAVLLARESHAQLVVLDEHLPDAPGSSVVRQFAAGVIMVSAADDAETVRQALAAGAVNYIIKPFPLEILIDRVTAYARFHRTLAGHRRLDQGDIDHAVALVRSSNQPDTQLRKGRSAVTATAIRDALLEAPEPLTAVGIADAVGVSRGTAQRYLADLVKAGQVGLALRYGAAGRPEHHYTWKR